MRSASRRTPCPTGSEPRDGGERSFAPPLPATLTEKQSQALRAAYHHGYFERPRTNSASEIADALGVSHATFLQHLRTAQRKVFASVYDD